VRIKIGPFDVEVIYTDDVGLIDSVGGRDDTEAHLDGVADFNNERIYIRSDRTEAFETAVLLHEIVHYLEWYGSEMTESQVNCMATGIFQVLKDNRDILELILGESR